MLRRGDLEALCLLLGGATAQLLPHRARDLSKGMCGGGEGSAVQKPIQRDALGWGSLPTLGCPHCTQLSLFLQTLSMLPTRILRLLEFVGFSGNKVNTCLFSAFVLLIPRTEAGLDRVQLRTRVPVQAQPHSACDPGQSPDL